jgi:hypothetical protein
LFYLCLLAIFSLASYTRRSFKRIIAYTRLRLLRRSVRLLRSLLKKSARNRLLTLPRLSNYPKQARGKLHLLLSQRTSVRNALVVVQLHCRCQSQHLLYDQE